MTDWNHWLKRYDRPDSPHSQRLRTVRRLIQRCIEHTAPKSISALSVCAGDGRDLLEVLARRSDASRVKATLVELDPRLCALARERVRSDGLGGVDIRQADAGTTDTYVDVPSADLVLLIGVFGNIVDADVRATLEVLSALCNPGALIIWSLRQQPRRNLNPHARIQRNDYERVEKVRGWFEAKRFREIFVSDSGAVFYVGAHRWMGESPPLPPAHRFFAFALPSTNAAPEP
jgi:SAM-dependent methyltransferase